MKLRISLDISDNVQFDPSSQAHRDDLYRHFRLIKRMIKDKNIETATVGFETKNKYGEPCRPHYHVHFYYHNPDIIDPKRSITQFLKSRAESVDIKLKGNKKWCLQLVEEPEDYNRFYRYPFKFGLCSHLSQQFWGDPLDDSLAQIRIAIEENKQRIDANCIHREKTRDKATFKDKLFEHLNSDEGGHPLSERHVWLAICKYYVDQGKPINFQTINGYTVLYRLSVNALNFSQVYEMRNNPQ